MNKYNARKTEIDGYTFDSKKEARRYGELCLLVKAGEITDLTVHPKFVLQEGFIDRDGKKIQPITYSADFQYWIVGSGPTGSWIVEDVKGGKATQTQLFKVKWKLVKKKYPDIDFRIVEE